MEKKHIAISENETKLIAAGSIGERYKMIILVDPTKEEREALIPAAENFIVISNGKMFSYSERE